MQTDGLHHITAVAGDHPKNRRGDTETPGLRLIECTVDVCDAAAYHHEHRTRRGTAEEGCGGLTDGGTAK